MQPSGCRSHVGRRAGGVSFARMAESKLTTKQELFVAAYLGDAHGNATEAARMAGYRQPKQQGHRLLTNVDIAARVAEKVENADISADRVLAELASVAFASWTEFVEVLSRNKDGTPRKVKMDLTNKVKALELLGKYHSLFVERQQIDVNIREHRVVGITDAEFAQMFAPAEKAIHA